MSSAEKLLEVDELGVSFVTEHGTVRAVDGVSFSLAKGEILAVVGESGSGKSVTAMTLLGLTRSHNSRFEGAARYRGTELVNASEAELRKIRGAEIAMIFQDPMSALNPVHRIGDQIAEQIQAHEKVGDGPARERTIELLERVGIPRARERATAYPHEFSGGMRQRVMIAMALSCDPSILIADEPTTALDVTIQAQILELLNELKSKLHMAVLLITHDMGVIAETAQRVVVMYAAKVAEEAPVADLFKEPLHPYTQGLLRSIPRIDLAATARRRLETIPGTVPTLRGDIAPGCRFAPRCPFVKSVCTEKDPVLKEVKPGHKVSCWLY
jgi:oligopeptide/dipeptide ABC transporter ATP-binding protein